MIRFARLYHAIDATTKTSGKLSAMEAYFAEASFSDAAWAIYFLAGNKPRQLVPTKCLRQWAAQEADIAAWLCDEAYHAVGDLAETISLVVPSGVDAQSKTLTEWLDQRLLPLRGKTEEQQRADVSDIWRETSPATRLVVMKLMTGAFRVGVSKRLATRAIANCWNIPADGVAHRLMGNWLPTADFFEQLIASETGDTTISQPYPFCLAHPIEVDSDPEQLGAVDEYAAEWKWDEIRGQLIRRADQTFIWSRGEELMERRWPEIETAAERLPNGTVLDGEILATESDGRVLPFAQLQRRIGRKTVGKKLLKEVPVVFHAFDLLELSGQDLRSLPWEKRRQELDALLDRVVQPQLQRTELLNANSWNEWRLLRAASREHNAEGLMIKRRSAPYDVGRSRGTWWKWKIAPYTIDAVLIYAQKGHGKRASLFTDYTFAVWDAGQLVPFAKAYSGLADAEIRQVDRFVRQHTQESFGPVRSVTPTLVMELAFEGLQRSTRHKSGIATRFPRIVRWRHDKLAQDANTLQELLALLPVE